VEWIEVPALNVECPRTMEAWFPTEYGHIIVGAVEGEEGFLELPLADCRVGDDRGLGTLPITREAADEWESVVLDNAARFLEPSVEQGGRRTSSRSDGDSRVPSPAPPSSDGGSSASLNDDPRGSSGSLPYRRDTEFSDMTPEESYACIREFARCRRR